MKNIAECRARLRGIFNITVTPFAADGAIDRAGLARSVERVNDLGFDGVLIGGTHGEFPALSTEECRTLPARHGRRGRPRARHALQRWLGRPSSARPHPVRQRPGWPAHGDAALCLRSDGRANRRLLPRHAPLSKTGILAYKAPGIGITLSPGLMERLADVPGVVGIKQGDLSPTAIDQIADGLGGRIRLFCASDLAFLGPCPAAPTWPMFRVRS